MAVRTDAESVRTIMNTNLTDEEIDVFISSANLMINTTLAGEGFTEEALTEIEKWLSAHLISITKERQAETKKAGDATDKYGKLGMKFESTTYGQMVLILDSSGSFANLGKKKAIIRAIPSFDDSPIL